MTPEPHRITAENAAKIQGWFKDRGGIAVWRSVNLSNPGASWTTPLTHADGTPATKPTWQADSTPERVITDQAEVLVDVPRLVKRFHVAVLMGDGMQLKLTDASSARVRRAVAKAGAGAWYEFDYAAQDALIFVPDKTVPLPEWEAPHG